MKEYKIGEYPKQIDTTLLTKCGVPTDMIRGNPFNLSTQVRAFVSEVDGLKPKRVEREKQLKAFDRLYKAPLQAPYVCVLAGMPNDSQANMVAVTLFCRALKSHLNLERTQVSERDRLIRNRTYPRWHTINGSFQDSLRDGDLIKSPSFLVISNVTVASTNTKLEKLRDLLRQYAQIPRVITLAGQDPITFANTKLFMGINYCMYLCKSSAVKDIEL